MVYPLAALTVLIPVSEALMFLLVRTGPTWGTVGKGLFGVEAIRDQGVLVNV
jgi:hypothetical protein